MEPIFDFAQAVLEADDVYILDAFTSLFVWMGSESNEEERLRGPETAAAYVTAKGYAEDTPIVTVHAGAEPALFTCHFLAWDHNAGAGATGRGV